MALLKIGKINTALECFRLVKELGFREWYHPLTGKGFDGPNMLWNVYTSFQALKRLEKLLEPR